MAIADAAPVVSAVTDGFPSRSPPTHVPHRRNAGNDGAREPLLFGVERAVDLAIDERKRREDRLVEQREHRADLVERLRSVATHRIGPPQAGDLLPQAAHRLGRLGLAEARVVEAVE